MELLEWKLFLYKKWCGKSIEQKPIPVTQALLLLIGSCLVKSNSWQLNLFLKRWYFNFQEKHWCLEYMCLQFYSAIEHYKYQKNENVILIHDYSAAKNSLFHLLSFVALRIFTYVFMKVVQPKCLGYFFFVQMEWMFLVCIYPSV